MEDQAQIILGNLELAAEQFASAAVHSHPRFGYPHDATGGVIISLLARRIRDTCQSSIFHDFVVSQPNFYTYWTRGYVAIAEIASTSYSIGSSLSTHRAEAGEYVLWHASTHVSVGRCDTAPLILDFFHTHFDRNHQGSSAAMLYDALYDVLTSEACLRWDFEDPHMYYGSSSDRSLMRTIHKQRVLTLIKLSARVTELATEYVRCCIDEFVDRFTNNCAQALEDLESPITLTWDNHSTAVR